MFEGLQVSDFRAWRAAFVCVALTFFLGFVALAGGTGELITSRCQGCHGMDKTCEVTVDDAGWWNETVLRMIEYKSGLLSDEEAAEVGQFLADGKRRAGLCSAK
jgi:hypothetical protein